MTTKNIIYANKDTFISSASPDSNFGKDLCLFLSKSDEATHKSLIYFDLSAIPANAKITSASLKLSLFTNNNDKTLTLNISQLTVPFFEYVSTPYDNINQKDLATGDISELDLKPNVPTPLIFPSLKNTISQWYDNSATNFGFMISISDKYTDPTSDIIFWSKEYYNADLRPNLQVEYTIDTSISNIETISSTETIYPKEKVIQSTIYDISRDLFFNYSIDNPKDNPPVTVTLLCSDSSDGDFINMGKEITCPAKEDKTPNDLLVEVLPLNKYVCLKVIGTGFKPTQNITITSTHKTFSNMISSSFSSALLSKNKLAIVLTMTKPLTMLSDEKTLRRLASTFTVIIGDTPEPVNITFTNSTQLTLTPVGGADIDPTKPLTITYKATEDTYLTGINGNVDNITNMKLTDLSCTFVRGEATGADLIILTMSQPLLADQTCSFNAFPLIVNDKPIFFNKIRVAPKTDNPTSIVVSIGNDVLTPHDVITISYIPTGTDNVKDALGNDIPAFRDKPISINFS